jgi:hypothetical protein
LEQKGTESTVYSTCSKCDNKTSIIEGKETVGEKLL